MKKLASLFLLVLCCQTVVNASGGNTSTNTDSAISSLRGRFITPKFGQFSFSLDQEIRSVDNFGAFKDARTSLSSVYDPLPWLRFSAGYTLLVKEGSDGPSIKHRAIFLSKQMFKFGNLSVRFRERLESTFVNGEMFGDKDSGYTNLLRTRLKLLYSKGKPKAVPYVYCELYNHTNESMMLSRIRSQAGVEYKLSASSKLTAFYQYSLFMKEATSTAPHTIGVLYAYTLQRK